MLYLLALLIGFVAGFRTMTAPAAVSVAAFLGCISLAGTQLAFLASPWAAGALALLAILELIGDKRPSTPSRKVPLQFGGRMLTGGLSGAAMGAAGGLLVPGLVAGGPRRGAGDLFGRRYARGSRPRFRPRSPRCLGRGCARDRRRNRHRMRGLSGARVLMDNNLMSN